MDLEEIKDNAKVILIWVAIIGGGIFLVKGCNWVKDRNAEVTNLKAYKEFSEFCSTNNVTPAFKDLPNADLLTLDLQRSLYLNEKRVAFEAKISDLWRSKKHGSMMVDFRVRRGGRDIDAYLKCNETQAQSLHDEYRKNKDATFLVIGEFERAEPYQSDSAAAGEESDPEITYQGVGTLVLAQVAKEKPPVETDHK